jgi:hypothetical protein
MSISLTLKLVTPLPIGAMLPKIGVALQEVLRLSETPLIIAEGYVNRIRSPLRSDTLSLGSGTIFFEIINEPEIASVVVYEIQHPLLSNEEQGVFTSVHVSSFRTPLEYALVAAVAASFSRELDTPVIDNRPFFTEVLSQSADSFVEAIKVKDVFEDYRLAAQAFYSLLPGIHP